MDNNKGYSRMTLDGCGKFLKYSIFIVNFLIFTLGMVIVGLGIWALVDGASMSSVLNDSAYSNSSAILLAFGGVVSFIAFLGCCGAIKEVKCLLLTFFIILLLISILIIVGVIFAFKIKDKVDDAFEEGLDTTINMVIQDKDEKMAEAWKVLQEKFKCCGINSYADWRGQLPESCKCNAGEENCFAVEEQETGHWDQGCLFHIKYEIEKHAVPLLAVGITIVVIIILAMVFSCALFMML